MPFQLFEMNTRVTSEHPVVSVARQGRLSLNQAAYESLGEPPFAELLYDTETRRIGLRPVREKTLASYAVTKHVAKSPTYYIHAGSFLRSFRHRSLHLAKIQRELRRKHAYG